MKTPAALGISILLVASFVPAVGHGGLGKPTKKMVTYKDVAPLLKACTPCHKGATAPKGIDLTSYAGIMKGGKKGKVVVAGNVAKSPMAGVLHGKPMMMPPAGALPAVQINTIESWIAQGAKD